MILSRACSLAFGCGLLLAASIAGAAGQETPAAAAPAPAGETAQQPAPGAAANAASAEATSEATGDKRICRYVKLDPSSRRKTKVCRTVEEWRELNNIR
jgi:hypothetical protein